MAAQSSFDIVSKVDLQEVRNAIDQVLKEIHQRFDFKGSQSNVTLETHEIVVISDDTYKLKAVLDILHTKLVKRGVSLKALVSGKVEQALGGLIRQRITLQQGIPPEKAKEIIRQVRERGFKVQAQILGDQIRVVGKSKDELQSVIQFVRERDFGLSLQFTNYR